MDIHIFIKGMSGKSACLRVHANPQQITRKAISIHGIKFIFQQFEIYEMQFGIETWNMLFKSQNTLANSSMSPEKE